MSPKMVARSCSSVHTVLSNEDLLTEILLRLPAISLHLFKSVSKHWFSLITTIFALPHTRQIHNIDPPSGFFVRHPYNDTKYYFVRLYNRIPRYNNHEDGRGGFWPVARIPRFKTAFKFGSNSSVRIEHSCNGLLLCKSLCSGEFGEYYIYNPSSNRFKKLPRRHSSEFRKNLHLIIVHMKLAFDPTKSPHYKVVYAQSYSDGGSFVQIQTYSSETGIWSIHRDTYPLDCFTDFREGIYWNDGIHWMHYLPNGLHYKLDIVNEIPVLTNVQLPVVTCGDEKVVWDHKLFESRGCLLLLCRGDNDSRQLNIYEMRKGYSEWSLKYFVDLDYIRFPIPKEWIRTHVWFIILGDREEDNCMVFKKNLMIVQYKIVTKTTSELLKLKSYLHFPVDSFLFTASLAGV